MPAKYRIVNGKPTTTDIPWFASINTVCACVRVRACGCACVRVWVGVGVGGWVRVRMWVGDTACCACIQ